MLDKKPKILCVDDDEFVRQIITDYLKKENYEMLIAGDGGEVRDVLSQHDDIDLILLDLILPDCDGISLLQDIKQSRDIPVIMISSKAEDIDRVIGLETGADDYMSKPFLPRELKARINVILKRHKQSDAIDDTSENNVLTFDGWTLDPAKYQLFDQDNKSANLTASEFLILHYLIMNAGNVIKRDKLFEITRNMNSDSFDRAVDIQITRIRKKLGDSAKSPKYIKTIRGVGYSFCGEALSN